MLQFSARLNSKLENAMIWNMETYDSARSGLAVRGHLFVVSFETSDACYATVVMSPKSDFEDALADAKARTPERATVYVSVPTGHPSELEREELECLGVFTECAEVCGVRFVDCDADTIAMSLCNLAWRHHAEPVAPRPVFEHGTLKG